MLGREEQKLRNSQFWEGFRNYIKKIPSSNGRRMNWLNYPSDVKGIYIRLQCDHLGARLCMDFQQKDPGIRAILWEQMTELKKLLEEAMKYPTRWDPDCMSPEGFAFGRIHWELEGKSFYKDEDWPEIYSFLCDRLVEFDEFYQEFKEILITLSE
ncbi:MAG: hypothetical protein RL632_1167 [Bacteroidota bacterium]|jgi:hypothetical protein